jgi:hypothetical protein
MEEIQGRLDIDDAERKNREANAKKSIQDLRDLREGKITNDELKERVRARGGSAGGIPKSGKHEMLKMKSGGPISKAVMQKAGFYDKGKTEKERQEIVKKVTTKPQRVAMVAKAFSTKNMNEGGKVGSASKRADGCAVRGKTRA